MRMWKKVISVPMLFGGILLAGRGTYELVAFRINPELRCGLNPSQASFELSIVAIALGVAVMGGSFLVSDSGKFVFPTKPILISILGAAILGLLWINFLYPECPFPSR